MKIKAIIVPGNGGDKPGDKWFPYVKEKLEKLGIETINTEFPDPVIARKEYWLPFLKELNANENTILIGHSSGAVAAMRYAENNKIFGSALMGVYTEHFNNEREKQSGYFDSPWNWDAIKNNQKWVIVFASTDDPFIPITMPREIRDRLKAEYHEFSDRGHWSQNKIPELVETLKAKIVLASLSSER